jgi:hypothetical protein
MPIIDQALTYRPIEEKLAKTTNPRHRMMLQRLLQHARGEVEEDLEAVLATLAPHPVYRVWRGPPEMNPEGAEAVRNYYIHEIFGKGRHCIESNKERIVVDDETIITEGVLRSVMWGRDARENGFDVDDLEAYYLIKYRMLVVWPFDEEVYIIGEQSYSAYPQDLIRKIDASDVPDSLKAHVARRRQPLPA